MTYTNIQYAKIEVRRLVELINYHNQKYWVEHKPEISDIEYDQLVESLRTLDPQNPALTALIEDTTREFKKVKHDAPMLSIEKVFTVEDVIKWATDRGAFCGQAPADGLVSSYKVDGLSCSLIYEDGQLIRAASRGNGLFGDDITRNVKTITDIPRALKDCKGNVEIRGEIYMSHDSFKAAIARFEKALAAGDACEEERPANPRNYCAGSIKQKDPRITQERNLSFMSHDVVGALPGADGLSDVSNLQTLTKLGFKTPFFQHACRPEEIAEVVNAIEAERKTLRYEIDGVVFGINRLFLRQELGSTSHHPRYRLAYKFSRDRGETTVKRIIWRTTRSGRVVPVMEVDPISLGGATVALCTLHHAKIVKDTGLVVGDRVLLEREVIPYFVQKVSDSATANLPTRCESCGAELTWDETATNLICPNLGGCSSQLEDYLAHYVSRGVTNMLGIGEKLIVKLIKVGLLKSPVDFYKLAEKQLLDNVERQGEVSARNIIAAITSQREQTFETFLVSLGIRGLGPAVAGKLAERFGEIATLSTADKDELMKVEGIAETMADTLLCGLAERKELIKELLSFVKIKEREYIVGSLSGKSYCLTGHVEFDYEGNHYDARPDIETLIRSKGGAIKNVSKTLNYLIVGIEPGSKVEKARKAGAEIITVADLIRLFGHVV
ncbi:MAG: NAD-dependent DNA ligase LigA [Planctomycetota bacterium]